MRTCCYYCSLQVLSIFVIATCEHFTMQHSTALFATFDGTEQHWPSIGQARLRFQQGGSSRSREGGPPAEPPHFNHWTQGIKCRVASLKRERILVQTTKYACSRTKKLCYRKDDRGMRHIHGCPENFRDSLTTPTATIPVTISPLISHFSLTYVRTLHYWVSNFHYRIYI